MKKEVREKFPKWVEDNQKFDLVLSDDIDSLLSCVFLKEIKGYEINFFYDFEEGVYKLHNTGNKAFAVDVDFVKGRCWGNHVTMLNKNDKYNKDCANLNVINKISRENYTDKFCGSTLLQILSYYNYDISNLSEEAKMVLLAIDGSYLGYYSRSDKFNKTNKYYLCDVLEFEELYQLQQRHKEQDFEDIRRKYSLKCKIKLNIDNSLYTALNLTELSRVFSMPIELPQGQFNKEIVKVRNSKVNLGYGYKHSKEKIKKKPFSLAVVYTNKVKYSYVDKK
ncbi:hypothetical protein [Clostridiisalibacter paucivorans]|uniref:hypothetical protein n=1 Tax=Clostridiisalibacter paucivorans TaxID=408753 RepID=UPI0004788F2D|nr:hypothetical protein [Clostridiisalibacter paucivorans]